MIGRSLGALALTAAVVLGLPDTSQAQYLRGWRWRGDGDWGWRDGRYSYYYGADYPSSVSFGYGPRYYSYGNSYGYYPGAYNRFGYGYRYYNAPTFYRNEAPGYSYRSAYPSPEIVNEMPDPGMSALAAVRVPNPDAQLWIEGQEMTSGGILRTFISPPLEPNSKYTYTIRATWMENGKQVDRKQVLPVRAGQRLAVDFTTEQPKSRGRQSGYGPDGKDAPLPAPGGAAQPRPEGKDRTKPPAPNPDESKPIRNSTNDKPENPDRNEK
jgi:uncharacterized protein (TIGR03000 family)